MAQQVAKAGSPALRLDLVAGLVAAAVVLPKAMAYASVAGLPVAVGLYTAFVPMVIYALLGSSRVLNVSSTTTLAILTATQLGLVVPDGDPARLASATAALTALVGAMLVLGGLLRLGFAANFISTPVLTGFKAGIGLVIVLDQVPKLLGIHIDKHGFFRDLLALVSHVPDTSLITLTVAAATFAILIGMERLWAHSPAPLVAVGGAIAASWFFGLEALGVSTVGQIPRGLPALTLPDFSLLQQLLPGALGIALMSFTESIAAGRAFASPADPPINANRELIATGVANLGGALVRCDAGRRRHVADGGRALGGWAVAAGVAGDRRRGSGHHAAPRPDPQPDAQRDTRGRGHRLFGRPDSAGRVSRHPHRSIDGVSLGAARCGRSAIVRHAQGHRRRDRRVDDRSGEPERSAASARHRPETRNRRAATVVARTPGRRDLRWPADSAAGRTSVLRQRAKRGRSNPRAHRAEPAARGGAGHEPCA